MNDGVVCDMLNRMHIIFLPQQARWLSGKRIDMHLEGSRIIPHK
jgi:hypothetical protein